MKKHKLLSIIIALLLLISTLFSCANTTPPDNEDDDKVTDNSNSDNTSNDTENKDGNEDELPKWEKEYRAHTFTVDDFYDSCILAFVFWEYRNYEYAPEDFKEINCIDVQNRKPNKSTGLKRIILTIDTDNKEDLLAALFVLEERADIQSVGPVPLGTGDSSYTNDPFCTAAENSVVNISLPAAWDAITTGGPSITVGVIDAGIDGTHPDLINRIDTTLSKNFYQDNLGPLYDEGGHGTGVAGIINAQGNNNIGIAGVCWKNNVKIVSLDVGYYSESSRKTFYDYDAFIAAIEYATEKGIDVINFSGSFTGLSSGEINAMRTAIQEYSGPFVCTAGNDEKNIDTVPYYPAVFSVGDNNTISNVISVGATDTTENPETKATFSNYGATKVSLFAPGVSITTCESTAIQSSASNGYYEVHGTSYAAPYVAGTAALLLSIDSSYSAASIKTIILDSVDVKTDLTGLCSTNGRLNVYAAISHAHTGSDYTQTGSFSQHQATCSQCNHIYLENHDWQLTYVGASVPGDNEIASTPITENELLSGGDEAEPQYRPQYVCNDCGMKSPTNPNLMQ